MFTNFLKIKKLKYHIYISIQTLYSVLCWSTFGSDYNLESSWVGCYKLGTPVFGKLLPFFSADPLKLCQVGWGVLLHSYFQVSPEMLDQVQVWAWLGHSSTFSHFSSECPWVAQPEPGLEPDRTSLERLENSCAATLPIQPHRAWGELQRMGQTPQIQVCQACSVIPKKTHDCNHCQRCFNKALSKGSEYLCKCDISMFNTFANISNNLFLLCHYGVLCVDLWGEKNI